MRVSSAALGTRNTTSNALPRFIAPSDNSIEMALQSGRIYAQNELPTRFESFRQRGWFILNTAVVFHAYDYSLGQVNCNDRRHHVL